MIVESGNVVNSPDKLDLVTSIFANLKYDAIGIGQSDLRVGEEYFKNAAEKKLVLVDAYNEKRGSALSYVIKNVGGVKVGIISFGAMDEFKQNVDEYALRRARFSEYKAARDASDVLILLDQGNIATKDWLERNSPRLGAPDIVIGGIRNIGMLKEDMVGKTCIVPTSQQGKHVGVVDVEIASDRSVNMSVKAIPLDPEIAEDEDIMELIRANNAAISQNVNIIKEQEVYSNPGAVNNAPVQAPVAQQMPVNNTVINTYYSPNMCKNCHSDIYDDWKQTKHAKAVKTLVDEKKVLGECLICHSEMYRQNRSVVIPSDDIAGVECATCHADVIPHGIERVEADNKTSVNPTICLTCHTNEHSPNYDEKTYFPKVIHAKVVQP